MSRSISQIQNRSVIGILAGGAKSLDRFNNRFSSNKRQSYKSVNQLYDQNSHQLLVCKDQQSNNSKTRKRNHDIIKEQIKLQNQNRNLSQKSALSEGGASYPGSMKGGRVAQGIAPGGGSASQY
jgi:hypothetical protein